MSLSKSFKGHILQSNGGNSLVEASEKHCVSE